MKQKQTDRQLDERIQEIMKTNIPESEILDKKMQDAYEQIRSRKAASNEIRKERKKDIKKTKLPLAVKCSTAAAILLLAMGYCVKNPALAAQLPFIGDIFSQLEKQVPYPGDYSSNAIVLPGGKEEPNDKDTEHTNPQPEAIQPETAKKEKEAAKPETNQAGSENAPQSANQTEHKNDPQSGSQPNHKNAPQSQSQADHTKDHSAGAYRITSDGVTVTLSEVSFDNKAVYLALLVQNEKGFAQNLYAKNQLDFECWVTMYKEDGSKKEFNEIDGTYLARNAQGEYLDAHTFRGLAQFTHTELDLSKYTSCEITFTDFSQMLETGKKRKANIPVTGEEVTIIDHDIVHNKGTWKFDLDIDLSAEDAQEIMIQEANAQGVGIEKIVKTKYEIYAVPILPEGEKEYNYFITMWDADGKPLEDHGDSGGKSIYGRDVSEVTVYVLWWEDFFDSKGENSYLQPEKALYQTKVKFQEET